MAERLRTCCTLCGSPNISKVKSQRIYRCRFCKQTFVTPAVRLVDSHKLMPKYLIIPK